MKLLITGSAGFIGSYAVKAAVARGWEVDSLDVRSQTHARRADVRLLSRVEADVVLHLAAYSSNAGFADNLAENYADREYTLTEPSYVSTTEGDLTTSRWCPAGSRIKRVYWPAGKEGLAP
jgi:NAD(P)-dependent dehydrogenase (short-subunit alcohol dehydrogenase family)